MKKYFKNLIGHNQLGFSLAEVLVAAGLLGVVSLGVSQVIKNLNQGQATSEVKMEEMELKRQILMNLTDEGACEETFKGKSLGGSVSEIKNKDGKAIFQVGGIYGNRALKLSSITTKDTTGGSSELRDVELTVKVEKLKKQAHGSEVKTIKIPLKVRTDKSSPSQIAGCYSDSDQLLEKSIVMSCESLGGTWDATSSQCINLKPYGPVTVTELIGGNILVAKGEFSDELVTQKDVSAVNARLSGNVTAKDFEGENVTLKGSLKADKAAVTSEVLTHQFVGQKLCEEGSSVNCANISSIVKSSNANACTSGQVQFGLDSTGNPRCVALTCPANQFFAGLDATGSSVCRPFPTKTCPANEYVKEVKSDGNIVCDIVPNNVITSCPEGEFISSINAGVPTCVKLDDKIKTYLTSKCQICSYFGNMGQKWTRKECKRFNGGIAGFETSGLITLKDLFYWEVTCDAPATGASMSSPAVAEPPKAVAQSCAENEVMTGIDADGKVVCKLGNSCIPCSRDLIISKQQAAAGIHHSFGISTTHTTTLTCSNGCVKELKSTCERSRQVWQGMNCVDSYIIH